jgi:hypothetical protein
VVDDPESKVMPADMRCHYCECFDDDEDQLVESHLHVAGLIFSFWMHPRCVYRWVGEAGWPKNGTARG